MKMSKIIKNIAFLIVLFLCIVQTSDAFFKSNSYTLPLGKSMLLGKNSVADLNLTWKSENSNIAEVNSDGIVTSKNKGKTKIWAKRKDNNENFSCEIEITNPEPVRAFFVSPNIVKKDDKIHFHVVTNTNVSELKFEIKRTNGNIVKTEHTTQKIEKENVYIWDKESSINESGKFSVVIYAKIGSESLKSDENTFNFESKSCVSIHGSNLDYKTVSDRCLKFIAAFEGNRKKVHKDSGGNLTAALGQKLYHGMTFYDNITKEEQYTHFVRRINNNSATKQVNKFLIDNKIKSNTQQFDALVSLSYNIGSAWLNNKNNYLRNEILERVWKNGEKDLNNIEKNKIIQLWSQYHHCAGKCLKGLMRRRFCELAVFFNGIYETVKFNPCNYSLPECYKNQIKVN